MTTPFTRAQIVFHWVSAVLILGMAATGMMYFWEIADAQAIRAHQVMGQILILVLAGRLIVKLRSPRRTHSAHSAWERLAAMGVHAGLYATMIIFVVTGYVAASAFRTPTLLFPVDQGFARGDLGETLLYTHYNMKWVLLALVAAHVAGALKHHFIDRDNTLRNMISSKGSS